MSRLRSDELRRGKQVSGKKLKLDVGCEMWDMRVTIPYRIVFLATLLIQTYS